MKQVANNQPTRRMAIALTLFVAAELIGWFAVLPALTTGCANLGPQTLDNITMDHLSNWLLRLMLVAMLVLGIPTLLNLEYKSFKSSVGTATTRKGAKGAVASAVGLFAAAELAGWFVLLPALTAGYSGADPSACMAMLALQGVMMLIVLLVAMPIWLAGELWTAWAKSGRNNGRAGHAGASI